VRTITSKATEVQVLHRFSKEMAARVPHHFSKDSAAQVLHRSSMVTVAQELHHLPLQPSHCYLQRPFLDPSRRQESPSPRQS